jgi:HSP20 family protein
MAAWGTWHTLETLRRELDNVFDESGTRTAPAFRTAFLPGRAARWYPCMNLYEDQEAVYLEALAPGVDPATLDLRVVGNTLSSAFR